MVGKKSVAKKAVKKRPPVVIEQPQLPAQVTPDQLLVKAMESGDLAQVEKFMDLKDRWEKNEARKAYVVAMADFRAICPAIKKTRDGHNSKYAGLAEAIETIKAEMSDCGLSHAWATAQDGKQITVTCTVTHILGHSESTSLSGEPDTSGSKNAIQAVGSTVEYLKRYTMFAILGLSSTDDDTDGNTPEPIELISEEQALEIHAKISENDLDMKAFMGWLKTDLRCEAIEHINVNALPLVHKRIASAIRAKHN